MLYTRDIVVVYLLLLYFEEVPRNSRKLTVFEKSVFYAKKLGLEVHAGHGLTYQSAYMLSKIKNISEFNIGHFIVSESVFLGIRNSIKKFKKILNK